MALLREGSEADFTPIVLPDVSITAGLCPLVLFSFTWFITKPWIFACAGFSAVFDLDSLEGSVLGVSFDVFFYKLLAVILLSISSVLAYPLRY